MKKVLTTPLSESAIRELKIGDTVYLSGTLVTCRDDGHRRLIEEGIFPEQELKDMAIFHAGPIVRKTDSGWEMISVGPTTSRRMEKYEAAFIEKSGIRMIIGKGGMGKNTAEACKRFGAAHCVFPGGCAVTAATEVEKIEGVEWLDFGMPEALWILKVKEFGPLIVSIDAEGNNLFENSKIVFNQRKTAAITAVSEALRFSKE